MAGLLFVVMFICLGFGRVWLTPMRLGEVLWGALTGGTQADRMDETVVVTLRMPRIALALLSGAVLAMCGGALQGTLRNPLVGPQTIGVLSGAGFGGSLALFFSGGPLVVMASAFVFGLFSIAVAVWIAQRASGSSVLGIVLAGIVISAFFAALTTLLQYFADTEQQLPSLIFWLMGSLSNATSDKFWWAAAPMALSCVILSALAFRINVLSSGDEEAASLGVNVPQTRALVLVAVAAGCAAVVAVAGVIAWIGLVAPHIARMLVGADHRRLLPASGLLGAALLLVVDTFCRSATTAEIPLGAATAIIGAPVFIAILSRKLEWV
jgi:iron complex transport system permease protein